MSSLPLPADTPADPPPLLRRLDWRFLLDDPGLDRVAYVGRRDDTLLAALRILAEVVDVADETPDSGSSDSSYDRVVAREPTAREVDRAARLLRPGGTLVVEARRGNAGSLARRMRGLGLEPLRRYGHWPAFEACTRIVPLDDRAALRDALAHTGRGPARRIVAALARTLLRLGMLPALAPWVCITGRRPRVAVTRVTPAGRSDAHESGASLIQRFLDAHRCEPELESLRCRSSPSFVVLTPTFRNSSHLVFLLLHPRDSTRILVAKLCRHRDPCDALAGEARRLREIQGPAHRFASIPRVVAIEAFEGHTVMLQTAVEGRGMDRVTVRRRTRACCDAVLEWLVDVQAVTRAIPGVRGLDLEALVGRPLLEIERLRLPGGSEAVAATREWSLPLVSMDLPRVLEHGDLSHPNLLVNARGGVAVIDWEQAELPGLPAVDLFFFLAYVARARAGARTAEESVRAVDQAFFGPEPWTRSLVLRYAARLGLPRAALAPLFVCCWARQVAGLAGRVSHRAAAPDRGAAGIERDWRVGAWRLALERLAAAQPWSEGGAL